MEIKARCRNCGKEQTVPNYSCDCEECHGILEPLPKTYRVGMIGVLVNMEYTMKEFLKHNGSMVRITHVSSSALDGAPVLMTIDIISGEKFIVTQPEHQFVETKIEGAE